MAVSSYIFPKAILSAFDKKIDLDTDNLKVMLVSAVPSGTQQFKSEITTEVTGTGYTAGGTALAQPGTDPFMSVTSKTFKFDAADVSWPSSTITARAAVIYAVGGSDATSPLIGYVDFGDNVSTTSGTFQIIWNSAGIFTVTVA